jgi:methylmalonyl-CoA/ethylmalonyl-CoA epimerase
VSSAPRPAVPLPGLTTLHHIGYVVASIENSVESFVRSIGGSWDREVFLDPIQKVRVTFLKGPQPGEAQIELVEPATEDSPVTRFLSRGGGLHHLCYEVDDLNAHLHFCRSVGTLIIREPAPAVAFSGRHIAWGLTKKRLLIEFLER